ncbi:MAG: ATP-binding protein [Spirochaetes bacterium]|nr:ATP-binding protein [Spirochaetota bacterium]
MKELKDTVIYKELEKRDDNQTVQNLITLTDEVFEESRQIHKTVIRHMPEYTLHDEEHILRTVELIGRLLPSTTLKKLTPLELAGLILSVSLHDIGLAPTQDDIRLILDSSDENKDHFQYQSFCEGYPEVLKRKSELRSKNQHGQVKELDAYLMSEYFRQFHGARGRKIIFDRFENKLIYENFNFTSQLAEICFSHTQDPSMLEKISCFELVRSPGEYVNWRFIATMLRIGDILDFDGKRAPRVLFEHLGIRDKVSLEEWKKHRSIQAWDIRPGRIAFSASCPDPVIEKSIRDFIKMMEDELYFARATLGNMHDPICLDMQNIYFLEIPSNIDIRNVGPEVGVDGPIYKYVDLGFHLDKESIISLVMGINLYGNRLLFLRELLQNAVDTCRNRQALHKVHSSSNQYVPKIIVELYEENNKWIFAIDDNGMGMDENIVHENFARIGKSYYRSARFLQENADNGIIFQPISEFGIGVLSVFMVTDQLRVQTRKLMNDQYDLDSPIDIEINGSSGLFWFLKSKRKEPGTKLQFCIKDPSFLMNLPEVTRKSVSSQRKEVSLHETVKQLAPHVEFPITVIENGLNYDVEGEWVFPESFEWHTDFIREVTIDLSLEGPDGLDGIIKVFLLQDHNGKFSETVEVEDEKFYCEALGEIFYNRLEQGIGYIRHFDIDYSEKEEGEIEAYSNEYESKGRWSQQGFHVPHPLFSNDEIKFGDASIIYPFVVHYDLNLSGDFTTTLTVDRLRSVDDKRFENVKKRVCKVISTLLLEKLGKEEVEKSQKFFEDVLENVDDEVVRKSFEICLKDMLNK